MSDESDESTESRTSSRRGFLATGAAMAAGGAALLGGATPAFAAGADEDLKGPSGGGVSALALPTRVPGTTMINIIQFDFTAFNNTGSITTNFVGGSQGAYSSSGGPLEGGLRLPVGSVIKQVDYYGQNVGASVQSWGIINVNMTATSASVDFTATTPSATGFVQATAVGTKTIDPGISYAVRLAASSASAAAMGAVVQYTVLGFTPVTPFRVYDSRWADGPLAGPNSRVVSVKDARDLNGNLATPNAVPVGASAVSYNLTLADTSASGFLAITPGNAGTYSASSINWSSGGLLLANGGQVNVDGSRQVKVFAGGGSTNFIVDITGYYI